VNGVLDRVALVTGAGQGIGEAIARRLGGQGAVVAVNSLHQDKANATADRVMATGARAFAVPGDVGDPSQVRSIVDRVEAAAGPVEILVNNAATLTMAPFLEFDPQEWDRIVRVNLSGPMWCARGVLPNMIRTGWGRIVTVASIWGTIGARGATAYCASKGGLVAFTRSLADEVGPAGVVVTAVAPGTVDTPQLEADARFAGIGIDEMKDRYALDTLVGRIASADEIAGIVALMAGDLGGAFQGQTIPVTGGRSE
jgi:NAD(P)-dependent dehydrogenase (short-subunit alcohol dehydrogenase family)